MIAAEEDGCSTPTRDEYQIRVGAVPPPPPRKKPVVIGKKRVKPKKGYFYPPDLETLFTINQTQACKIVNA